MSAILISASLHDPLGPNELTFYRLPNSCRSRVACPPVKQSKKPQIRWQIAEFVTTTSK